MSNPKTPEQMAEEYASVYKCPAPEGEKYCYHDVLCAFKAGHRARDAEAKAVEEMMKRAAKLATDRADKYLNCAVKLNAAYDKLEAAQARILELEEMK